MDEVNAKLAEASVAAIAALVELVESGDAPMRLEAAKVILDALPRNNVAYAS